MFTMKWHSTRKSFTALVLLRHCHTLAERWPSRDASLTLAFSRAYSCAVSNGRCSP